MIGTSHFSVPKLVKYRIRFSAVIVGAQSGARVVRQPPELVEWPLMVQLHHSRRAEHFQLLIGGGIARARELSRV